MRKILAAMAIPLLSLACGPEEPSRVAAPSEPTSPTSEVLTLSDSEVAPGQTIEVSFDPPPDHDVWGVAGELWQERDGDWKRIAWTSGWVDKRKMSTYWPTGETAAFPDIGFQGSASWRWKVPARLEPGNYELRKEWLPKAPASPDRPVTTERAPFTVTG